MTRFPAKRISIIVSFWAFLQLTTVNVMAENKEFILTENSSLQALN